MDDQEKGPDETAEKLIAAQAVADAAEDFRKAFIESLKGAEINIAALVIEQLRRFEIAQMQLAALCTELVETGILNDIKSGERFAKDLREAATELRKPRIATHVGRVLKNGSPNR